MGAERIDALPAREIVNKMITTVLDRPTNGMVPAMYSIEENFKLPFWRLDHLRRRAVTVEIGFFRQIRKAYIRLNRKPVLRTLSLSLVGLVERTALLRWRLLAALVLARQAPSLLQVAQFLPSRLQTRASIR